MLTPKQREELETGKIRENPSTQLGVRESLAQTIADFNKVIRHHSLITGQQSINDIIPQDHLRELTGNLLYLVEDECIDENIVWTLLSSCEECWTVENTDMVHGSRQEIAMRMFLVAWEDWDSQEPMTPSPDEIPGWDDFYERVQELDHQSSDTDESQEASADD
jgi:hypothetical protein